MQLLLDAGADPNEPNQQGATALHWAVWRGRSVKIITTLLDRGAGLNVKRHDGRTAYALAILGVAKRSWRNCSNPGERIPIYLRLINSLMPLRNLIKNNSLLSRISALSGSMRTWFRISQPFTTRQPSAGSLAAGLPVNARGEHGGTALHWACWKGYADLVKLLLDHHAALDIKDEHSCATFRLAASRNTKLRRTRMETTLK